MRLRKASEYDKFYVNQLIWRMIILKNKVLAMTAGILTVLTLTACGKDPQLTQFKEEIDAFCTEISDIDTEINNVDAQSENATEELLGYLDQLDAAFQDFAALDFPTEFDYLESLADEAGEYMTNAVESYHDAYSNGGYNQLTADYAKENYARAYKRIQIIITFLHGEQPEDVNLTTAEETTDAETTSATE